MRRVVDETWALWSIPSYVYSGDSRGGIFLSLSPTAADGDLLAANVSDGGQDCRRHNNNNRLDTRRIQNWIDDTVFVAPDCNREGARKPVEALTTRPHDPLLVAIGDNACVAHVEPEDLQHPERIFMARTVRQARKVEELLTEAGVDYVVQVEPYSRSIIFGTIRHGAAFYVGATQAAYCRERLIGTEFGKGVVESDPTERN